MYNRWWTSIHMRSKVILGNAHRDTSKGVTATILCKQCMKRATVHVTL